MKFLLIALLNIVSFISMAQVKPNLSKKILANGKVQFSTYIDANCNNKKDTNEPLLQDFKATHYLQKNALPLPGLSVLEFDSLQNGMQYFVLEHEYTLNGNAFVFNKKEELKIIDAKPIKKLIGIKTHCSVAPTKNTSTTTNNGKPKPVMHCGYSEEFSNLKNWKSKTNAKTFAIEQNGLKITTANSYNALTRKLSAPLPDLFDASFDLYVNVNGITTVNYFPFLFTEGDLPQSTCLQAVGFLLKSDSSVPDNAAARQASLFITAYQKTGINEIVKTDWENIIPISKNKWYKIYFAKITETLFAIQAYDPTLNDWSKKIFTQSPVKFNSLSHIQISSDAQPQNSINTSIVIDNICIKKSN